MLQHLSIKHYALIENLEIDFDKALNILTGETGSGKSIILGALGLIIGERAETRVVQEGKKKCVVEASFNISGMGLESQFKAADLDFEQVSIIRREILSTGKSRAFVNDTPVTLSVLKELSLHLLDIHSQHQTIQINDPKFQLNVLDRYADTFAERASYRSVFSTYTAKQKELAHALEMRRDSVNEADFIRFQVQELRTANLDKIDEETFEEEYNTLANAEEITQTLSATVDLLNNGENPVIASLNAARELLGRISSISKSYAEIAERLKSSIIEIDDIAGEVENTLSGIEANPARLGALEELRATVFRLEQKHNVDGLPALKAKRDDLEAKLSKTDSLDEDIEQIEKALAKIYIDLKDAGAKLTAKRAKNLKKFSSEIEKVLGGLNMKSATLVMDMWQTDEPNTDGFDKLTMLFSANAGRKPEPLKMVASGGELSRLMLAIKKLYAIRSDGKTIIFDEIDTGVSGEVANSMGSIMKEMASEMQIICITHLPQIASKGVAHYKVFKTEANAVVKTEIERLNNEERIVEIAQMLSGANTSDAALANARELLELN
ncbi:DNA repair protein RecN [Cryomorpha ignava]|uniref:DNA repair protein RecN n=1 Tax=Cryomorpha ignava TaxID=101383 RepID=A0A7K3WWS1_9FLAO|nr:DNA repair protein RecN [Cryomorpha ignava]NEN25501.1 DNA repair protein RecN [Cryomorpha ignava]